MESVLEVSRKACARAPCYECCILGKRVHVSVGAVSEGPAGNESGLLGRILDSH